MNEGDRVSTPQGEGVIWLLMGDDAGAWAGSAWVSLDNRDDYLRFPPEQLTPA